MVNIFYALLYMFEAFTVFVFYENIFDRKEEPDYWNYRAHTVCIASFTAAYAIYLLDLMILNVIVFFIICVIICLVGYESKLRSAVFMSLLLTVIMVFSECIVTFATSTFLKIDLTVIRDETGRPVKQLLTYFILVSLTKLIFFLATFILSRTILNKNRVQQSDRFAIVLGILPMTTILIFYYFIYLDMNFEFSDFYYNTLIVCAVFLILTNILVFFIYDIAQRTNRTVTQLQLEKQKELTRIQYYELLMNEHENYKILVHDIKRHLSVIQNAAAEGNCNSVTDYIEGVREQLGLDSTVQYSGNKLIDVIINRYVNYCKDNDIRIETETLCSSMEFMNDADITALLDNMFENAVESAMQSRKREISFRLSNQNEHFLIVNMTNSCDTSPTFKEGIPVSVKRGKNHGIGTKSMRKIIKRYDGTLEWKYDKDEKIFECEAIIKQ